MKRPKQSKRMKGKNNPNWKGGKVTIKCDICGKKFKRFPSLVSKRNACSDYCKKRLFHNFPEYKIHALYFDKNLSMHAISKKLNCSRTVIRNIFKRNNWIARSLNNCHRNNRKYNIKKKKLYDLYINKVKTVSEIAELFNCSPPIIIKNLKENKIPIRTTKESLLLRKSLISYKNPNWKGGISNLPWGFEFNQKLKDKIRKRDNYKCELCGLSQKENIKNSKRRLSVHHIDYNKQNCNENNLISLCTKCHSKTNGNRDYWYAYFKYILKEG